MYTAGSPSTIVVGFTSWGYYIGNVTASPNTWYHITLTIDESYNFILYVNGNNSDSGTGTGALTNLGVITLGGTMNLKAFNGSIDEFIVYDRVISAGEVLKLYNKKNVVDGIVIYQPLNKPTTSTIIPDPPAFLPTSITGCRLWLDGSDSLVLSGSNITGWTDKSGNGYGPTVLSENKPQLTKVGGLNAAYFDNFNSVNYMSGNVVSRVLSELTPVNQLKLVTNTNDSGTAGASVTTQGSISFTNIGSKNCAYFNNSYPNSNYLTFNLSNMNQITVSFWMYWDGTSGGQCVSIVINNTVSDMIVINFVGNQYFLDWNFGGFYTNISVSWNT